MCVFSESDSLHEDRRAGLIPELEGEEDSSKINPPSNGTVACDHTTKLPNVVCVVAFIHYNCVHAKNMCTGPRVENITGTLT